MTPGEGRGRALLRRSGLAAAMVALVLPSVMGGPARAAPPDIAARCTPCHGADGLSKLPNAPNLAGQPEMYLVEALEAYRSGERRNGQMSVVAGPLSDEDIAALAAWFSSIEITAKPPQP